MFRIGLELAIHGKIESRKISGALDVQGYVLRCEEFVGGDIDMLN